jgi:ribonuclease P protein component
VKTGHLDVRIAPSPLSYVRVGIIVPKYKRTIVERNKLRRRLRELVRTRVLPVIVPSDVLIRPLPHAYQVGFDVLAREIDGLVARFR